MNFHFIRCIVDSVVRIHVMAEELGERPRVKFNCEWTGTAQLNSLCDADYIVSQLSRLSELYQMMEGMGLIPILQDGLVAGNCSCSCDSGLFVSKSGKEPGSPLLTSDFVLVADFDRHTWKCRYKTLGGLDSSKVKPSSDTPLHFFSLQHGSVGTRSWKCRPRFAIHGHALANGVQLERARMANFPVSARPTMFSTEEDLEALESLYIEFPYPEHQCFIRKGHGFILLTESIDEALFFIEKRIRPLLSQSKK